MDDYKIRVYAQVAEFGRRRGLKILFRLCGVPVQLRPWALKREENAKGGKKCKIQSKTINIED